MALYFLRHIKTKNNELKIFSGAAETEVLTNQKIVYSDDILKFDYLFSSTSKRCIETIRLIPFHLIENAEIVYTNNLLERRLGKLEGMNKDYAKSLYSQCFYENRLDINAQIPGMESLNDVKNRVFNLVSDILEKSKNTDCLICSHNQTLKIIFAIITNQNIDNKYWRNLDFDNGVITKIL